MDRATERSGASLSRPAAVHGRQTRGGGRPLVGTRSPGHRAPAPGLRPQRLARGTNGRGTVRRRALATAPTHPSGRPSRRRGGGRRWKPTVLYPRGPTPARITADPFEVPNDLPADSVHDVRIELPGGRVHGVVVAADGTKSAAVVHALRGVRMAAQQRTDESGHFDFVGLAPGTYQLDAQSLHGSTAQPVAVTIDDEESRELTLVTEPYVRLSGYVVTPDGRPASGAIIKYPVDGIQWDRIVADVRGYFERDLPSGVKTAQLIVLTFAHPAKLLTSPVGGGPIHIPLRGDGGVVRFRGPAVINGRGVTAPVHVFRFESTGPFSASCTSNPAPTGSARRASRTPDAGSSRSSRRPVLAGRYERATAVAGHDHSSIPRSGRCPDAPRRARRAERAGRDGRGCARRDRDSASGPVYIRTSRGNNGCVGGGKPTTSGPTVSAQPLCAKRRRRTSLRPPLASAVRGLESVASDD